MLDTVISTQWPILSSLILLPLIGSLVLLVMRDETQADRCGVKWVALFFSLLTLALSAVLWWRFDHASAGYQFVENIAWFPGMNISYHLGVDGISLYLLMLTAFLQPICILAGWGAIEKRLKAYLVCFMVLESFVIGVFCALDMVLFYLFFEGMLIPMYLIIGIWGGDNRVYAAFKFFLYTLLGSVLLLVALLYIYNQTHTTDIVLVTQQLPKLPLEIQKWLWLAFFASFAVKVPMWPFHTWLPDAHVQAPTAGSVILAGILLKMGGYGFIRFSLPMLPAASVYYADLVYWLSVIAVIYTSLVALVQQDMKKLIAYSSVAHMGMVTLGIFSFSNEGIQGAMMQMISHGLVSGALFMCVGVVYDRLHTREIARYGGLVERMPAYAFVFLFLTMASVGLPGTSGFVGEILVLLGIFSANKLITLLAATGMILGAAYALWLYRRIMLGELTKPDLKKMLDLDAREWFAFAPVLLLVLALGIYPTPLLQSMQPAIGRVLHEFCDYSHQSAIHGCEALTISHEQPILNQE
ncbi:NADH-quinone oxidoreductase subunit M [bacterium]|nr:NADH-quinone oxidoreductase subunit M [bacterium]